MRIFARGDEFARRPLGRQILASLLSLGVLVATGPLNLSANQSSPGAAQATVPTPPAPPHSQQTPAQLQQLVAPIALYPDSLVAQILAGSTFPEQIVEANRWLQAHPDLKDAALAQAVDQQPWDPSVKALIAFPSVLGNMDKNLAWTSSLGDAYYNQQQDVMDAIQMMRQRAEAAGNLKTTAQQTVTAQASTVIIQPVNPDVVYVPTYDPWVVYGDPILPWPGWYPYPGIWFAGPYLSFEIGFGIGFFAGFGWGWPHWGFDWHNHFVMYNHNRYYSRSATFYNRNNFYRGAGARGGSGSRANAGNGSANGNGVGRGSVFNRPGATARPFNGNSQAARGYAQPRGQSGVRSGAFSGYGQGGQTRSFSSHGSSSFGGSGGSHGGGGGHAGGHR